MSPFQGEGQGSESPPPLMKKVVLLVILWRLLLFLPLLFLRSIPTPADTRYLGISPWANFDGIQYLSIAMRGYITEARFFPLYPLLIKGIQFIFSLPITPFVFFLIGFFISNAAFLLAALILYKLLRIEYSHKISLMSILFLLLFPTSFFFGSVYAESVFILLAVLSFYFARKRKWILSIVLATLLPITRSVGIVILPALFVEWLLQQKEKNKPSSFILYSLFIILIGLVGYAVYNFVKWGNWLYFIQAQTELGNSRSAGIILIPQTLFRYGKMLLTVPVAQYVWHVALLELAVFIFSAVLLYIAYLKKIRLSYLIFALLAFLIPTSTGTFTGLPRYVIILFPMFTVLALIKNKTVKIIYSIISVLLLILLLMLFAKGYYIA